MTFHKYPKIKIIGDEENQKLLENPEHTIIIQEKIDGANFRFANINGNLVFGSRNTTLGNQNTNIGGNWKRCVQHIKDAYEKEPQKFRERTIFYGECCVKHTMNYNWQEIPPFLGFDVLDMDTEKFLNNSQSIFEYIGLTPVPEIKRCKAKDIKQITDKDVPNSKYASPSAKDQQAEGIVLKNYFTEPQTFAKYVRQKFKEKNLDTFGGSKKWAEDDSSRIVAIYCTNARIDKNIFKLVQEGHKLELSLMHKLPQQVLNDIYEENYKEICNSQWTINFRKVKKKVSTRCLNVLQQIITNNNLSNEGKK